MQSIVSQSEYEVDSATYEADVAGKDAFVTQFLDFMFCKDKVQSRPRYVIVRRVCTGRLGGSKVCTRRTRVQFLVRNLFPDHHTTESGN